MLIRAYLIYREDESYTTIPPASRVKEVADNVVVGVIPIVVEVNSTIASHPEHRTKKAPIVSYTFQYFLDRNGVN